MSNKLDAYMEGRLVGAFTRSGQDRIAFQYSQDWIRMVRARRAHPISVSLPARSDEDLLDATSFVAGLLPDSTRHRMLLAAELDIEDDPSDFNFLARMGRDSAGALTIIPEEESLEGSRKPGITELSEAELAEHLRSLPRRPLLIDENEGVMLSLAGVNDKTAVTVRKGQIGLPHGGFPSTHIIKVDIPGLEDSIRTEQFCLDLARLTGLKVPKSEIRTAEDQTYMIMARYDRTIRDGRLSRIHQEDFCQALGVMPGKKYQRKGGPGWAEAFDLLQLSSEPVRDRQILLKEAIFQFLSGNPDAHAKNYSLVYRGAAGDLKLSPLYDLNNAAAFRHHFKKARPIMAMSFGQQDNPEMVTVNDFADFAEDCGFSKKLVIKTVQDTAIEMLGALPGARARQGACEAIDRAYDDIEERCLRWSGRELKPEISPVQDLQDDMPSGPGM
jgi:serine/threonine-protein kinase HipA